MLFVLFLKVSKKSKNDYENEVIFYS